MTESTRVSRFHRNADGQRIRARRRNCAAELTDPVLCENSVQAESLDNRHIRDNLRMAVLWRSANLIARHLESGAPCTAATSWGTLRINGLAAASARVRRAALRRLGQPAATGRH